MSSSQNSIRNLEPREHVRLRPGMYIGGINSEALHYLAFEILHYAAEQAYLKNGDHIWIELHPYQRISIRDNSAGISVEPYVNDPIYGTQLEAQLRKFSVGNTHQWQFSLYNLGLAAINALCEEFIVDNCREGVLWQQVYYEGKPYTPLFPIAKASNLPSGTTFTFIPDFTILERN